MQYRMLNPAGFHKLERYAPGSTTFRCVLPGAEAGSRSQATLQADPPAQFHKSRGVVAADERTEDTRRRANQRLNVPKLRVRKCRPRNSARGSCCVRRCRNSWERPCWERAMQGCSRLSGRSRARRGGWKYIQSVAPGIAGVNHEPRRRADGGGWRLARCDGRHRPANNLTRARKHSQKVLSCFASSV